MVDAHAHLTFFPREERMGVLQEAMELGVERVLVPATGREDVEEVANLPRELGPAVVVALGFHPHNASELDSGWKKRLEGLAALPSVVAIGEIGLDYHYLNSPKEDQRAALLWQLDLAREAGLPVVLHHREAWEDFVKVFQQRQPVRGVVHSFTEGAEATSLCHELGFYVGISGMVTFPRGENVRQVARAAKGEMLLLETDSPYLAPVPHRGQTNRPALVRLVAERVALERELALQELEHQTDRNFAALFLGA